MDAVVQLGTVRWKVLSVSSRKSLPVVSGGEKTARGRFILVVVEAENAGSGRRSVTSLPLLDDEGRKFFSSNDVFDVRPEQILLVEDLLPHLPFQYTDVYEVPEDARGLMIQVSSLEVNSVTAFVSLDQDTLGRSR
jgi:hypothetical protein